jgi:hypothetical protein
MLLLNSLQTYIHILMWFLVWILKQPLQEPDKMTRIIVEALKQTGQRGIINKGWGGLGNCESWFLLRACHQYTTFFFCCSDCEACSDFSFSGAELNKSKSVYLLDNCPHDWLFPRCTAVVPTKFFLVESKVVLNYKWILVDSVDCFTFRYIMEALEQLLPVLELK